MAHVADYGRAETRCRCRQARHVEAGAEGPRARRPVAAGPVHRAPELTLCAQYFEARFKAHMEGVPGPRRRASVWLWGPDSSNPLLLSLRWCEDSAPCAPRPPV